MARVRPRTAHRPRREDRRARPRRRPRHAQLASRGAARRPLRLGPPRPAAARAARPRSAAGRHASGGRPAGRTAARAPNVAPRRAADFQRFVQTAARRYGFVTHWIMWNEPNKATWLKPASPKTYVTRILNPGYKAVKSVSPPGQGRRRRHRPARGRGGTSPVVFIRGMDRARAQARRLRAPSVPGVPRRHAVRRRVQVPGPDDGEARAAAPHRRRSVPASAHLADGVRVPDEPARPLRRLARAAGALRRRGRPARLHRAQRSTC